METVFSFFHSEGNRPVKRACLKIVSNDMQIESPQIFGMWILMLSCPWALFEVRL